mmetsp:Transcript_131611/g.262645  ORF Transcript_131611/g.262645 Transcript_131611/m.262645 type:complete len:85 (+) Transcript_131611:352-606(+)
MAPICWPHSILMHGRQQLRFCVSLNSITACMAIFFFCFSLPEPVALDRRRQCHMADGESGPSHEHASGRLSDNTLACAAKGTMQ